MNETPIKEWAYDPKSILASPRKVQGIFHQPVIDKDGELISPKGMREAVPDFMHLPALHDFHKERPVGLATKVMELSGGRFYFEGVIKATSDCDDVWEKVKSGNYDQVSIFGKRTKYNNQCALPQNMRSGPCITDGVRLDSISVCDENARNPQTSLEVKKAKVIIDADTIGKQWGRDNEGNFVEITKSSKMERVDKLFGTGKHAKSFSSPVNKKLVEDTDYEYEDNGEKKAETAGESNLMHTPTDYAKEEDFAKKAKKCPCKTDEPQTIRKEEVEKADGDDYDEDRPTTKEKGSWVKPKKDSFNPMRETGAPIPKRTKSGYPLHADKNEPRQKPSSGKPRQYAPDPSEDSKNIQRRNLGAEAVSHYEGEAAHRKGVKNALEQVERPKDGRAKVRFSLGVRKSGETMEKGKRPKVTEEPYDGDERPIRRTRKDVRQCGEIAAPEMKFKKGDDEDVEKGAAEEAQEDMYEDDDYDHVEHSDSDGKWNKNKDPNGTVKMSKAQDKGKPEEDEEEEEYEEDEEDEDEKEVEKGTRTQSASVEESRKNAVNSKEYGEVRRRKHSGKVDVKRPRSHSGQVEYEEDEEVEKGRYDRIPDKSGSTSHKRAKENLKRGDAKSTGISASSVRRLRTTDSIVQKLVDEGEESHAMEGMRNLHKAKGDEDNASELFDPSTVTKGEQMEEHETDDVEYVTKALVPIEEIDTIVKARTEEISKAYMGQLDEIKKAYDDKIGELATKIEKMENETIRKGGSVVVIPELMSSEGSSMSNADALARMQAGR
jgi:hypothetical protein